MLQRQSRGLKNTFWKEEECDSRLEPGVKTRMPGPLEGGTVAQMDDTCVTLKERGVKFHIVKKFPISSVISAVFVLAWFLLL